MDNCLKRKHLEYSRMLAFSIYPTFRFFHLLLVSKSVAGGSFTSGYLIMKYCHLCILCHCAFSMASEATDFCKHDGFVFSQWSGVKCSVVSCILDLYSVMFEAIMYVRMKHYTSYP